MTNFFFVNFRYFVSTSNIVSFHDIFAENPSYLDLYTLYVFRKIQLILGHENLRIFLEYFEAQNADLLRIEIISLHFEFRISCILIGLEERNIQLESFAVVCFARLNQSECRKFKMK